MHGGEPAVAAPEKEKIIYARVSSPAQRGDLQRQSDDLRAKYPTHVLITDIASGINFAAGLKPFWTGHTAELSASLWLPTKIDCRLRPTV
jgi:hypothetical protein